MLGARRFFSGSLMCYFCNFTGETAEAILHHTIGSHRSLTQRKFGLRKKHLSADTGIIGFMSVHFDIEISTIISHLDSDHKAYISNSIGCLLYGHIFRKISLPNA